MICDSLIRMNAPLPDLNVPHPHRFTVNEFEKLCSSGMFDEVAKTELIEGEIFCMNAQFSRHARVKSTLLVELTLALRGMKSELTAISEVAVRLSDNSMPEPDIVLTSYTGDGAVPLDTVALIIEVSDTTLNHDLGRKADLYAASGVPEYWVVDVTENRVLMHSAPKDGDYPGQWDIPFGETLHSLTVDGLSVESRHLS